MSNVTSVVLTTSGSDDLTDLSSLGLTKVDQLFDGSHVLQGNVYIGAFKGLDESNYINKVIEIPWEDRRSIRLLMLGENEDMFRLIF